MNNNLEQVHPFYKRDTTVIMGRQDYLTVLYRLIAAELYILRRRRLSKMLIAISVASVIGFVLLLGVFTWSVTNRPLSDFVPPFCTVQSAPTGCVSHLPTRADMKHYQQLQLHETADELSMPLSFRILGEILFLNILFILVIILVGTMVGGEYSLGTVRLLFTRGPTRLQFLLAKLVTSILCIVPAILFLTVLGVLLGEVLYSIFGFTTNWSFFTTDWLGHTILYVLLEALAWFAYAMLALFVGTLARSTVAAIVAPFIWSIVETVLRELINAFTNGSSGSLSNGVKAIPDYFIGNNVVALLDNQGHIVFGGAPSSLSDIHALSVLAVYLVVFIGLSCWLTVKRDVTN